MSTVLGRSSRPGAVATASAPVVLAGRSLRKSFRAGGRTVAAVADVSIDLRQGEVTAFLGPNGAGKSTLVKMLAGLVTPDAGEVLVLGHSPHDSAAGRRALGVVLEGNRNSYWRLTAMENLEYFGVLHGLTLRAARARGAELLERLALEEKRDVLVQHLSRGMQQRLAIAIALVHRPQVVLLDEPILGIDVEVARSVAGLIRSIADEGGTVMMTTHQLGFAEGVADRVAILRAGCLVTDEGVRALLSRHSGKEYTIEVAASEEELPLDRLRALGVSVDGSRLSFLGEADVAWRVLRVLEPLPIVRMERKQATLDEVFERIVVES